MPNRDLTISEEIAIEVGCICHRITEIQMLCLFGFAGLVGISFLLGFTDWLTFEAPFKVRLVIAAAFMAPILTDWLVQKSSKHWWVPLAIFLATTQLL